MQTKESVERQYELLFKLYGVQSGGWSIIGLTYFLKNAVYSCLTGLKGD